jgi:Tfp pilus assembly protein PilF
MSRTSPRARAFPLPLPLPVPLPVLALRAAVGLIVVACAAGCGTTGEGREARSAADGAAAGHGSAAEGAARAGGDHPPGALATASAAAVAPASKDGIDDDNWLPKQGGARDTFLHAVEQARTDPAGAVPRFVEAAGKTTYFYAAWFNAGAAAEASGDVAMAEKYYRQALQVRPDYGPALANLAALLEKSGRGAEARRLVDEAIGRAPERAGPHLAAATLAWSKKDAATAEREALAAIKYDERNVGAMHLMAMIFRSQGRLDTARFALENALLVEPGNALLHLELGYVLLEQKDEKAAIVSFEKAARLRPTLLEAQDNYGVLLLRQGMAAEALKAFELVARLDPRSARGQLHLGNGLRAVRQYPQAEQAYRKALQLDASMSEALFNLGVLYIDNALPGMDEIARLQKGVASLKEFKAKSKPDGATLARLDDYIETTDKRIQRELKRRERDERRRKEDAAAAAAPAAPAPAPAADKAASAGKKGGKGNAD